MIRTVACPTPDSIRFNPIQLQMNDVNAQTCSNMLKRSDWPPNVTDCTIAQFAQRMKKSDRFAQLRLMCQGNKTRIRGLYIRSVCMQQCFCDGNLLKTKSDSTPGRYADGRHT